MHEITEKCGKHCAKIVEILPEKWYKNYEKICGKNWGKICAINCGKNCEKNCGEKNCAISEEITKKIVEKIIQKIVQNC